MNHTVNYYVASVKHDTGKVFIKTTASSEASAVTIICQAEGCAKDAVHAVEVPFSMFSMNARTLYKTYTTPIKAD